MGQKKVSPKMQKWVKGRFSMASHIWPYSGSRWQQLYQLYDHSLPAPASAVRGLKETLNHTPHRNTLNVQAQRKARSQASGCWKGR
eukprot:2194176-Amphidinium_carterae.1